MEKVLMVASASSHFRNFHVPYIKYLQQRGTEVFTAANGAFELENVVHTELKFKKKITSPANVGVVFKLAGLIRRERFDAVYTNSTLAGIAGRLAAILSGSRKTRCRHICHGYLFNDDGSRRSKLYLAFEKLVKKRTELLAVMNKDDLEIANRYSLGNEIVFINGMGLDSEKFPGLSAGEIAEQRKRLGAENGETLFLCVGEFSARKNQSAILQACARLKRADYRMVFAGDGDMLEECKALSETLGLSEKTIFLGHCKNVNLLYRSCDCLISASRFEGLPFNVMEALYCGESIIVSNVKGNSDLARDGELYDYGDIAGLAELMEAAVQGEAGAGLPERFLLRSVFDENVRLLKF